MKSTIRFRIGALLLLVPTNVLASRLKELEADGLVVREARAGSDRSVVYRTTPRAEELQPALDALSRWGAAGMREPRGGEVVTDASLVASLRVAAHGGEPPRRRGSVTYEVRVGPAVAHATVTGSEISVQSGAHPAPGLVIIGGPGFRDVLAGVLDPDAAVAAGAVALTGDRSLLGDFTATFTVPYTDALPS